MPDPVPPALSVLLVEDDEDDVVITRECAAGIPWAAVAIDWAPSVEAGLAKLRAESYDLLLVDYRLGASTGVEFLETAHAEGCTIPAIMVTGQGDTETAVAAMRAGAVDFLTKKGLSAEALGRAMRAAREQQLLRGRLDDQRDELRTLERRRALLPSVVAALGHFDRPLDDDGGLRMLEELNRLPDTARDEVLVLLAEASKHLLALLERTR